MALLYGISLLPEKKAPFIFYPAETVVQRCSVKKMFLEFHKIHMKTPMPGSLF